MRTTIPVLTALACFWVGGPVRAADISSNAVGGGPWTDPATWHGKKVPGPEDSVVIQKHDVVIFDRNDDGKITCKKLQIDPKGTLLFKTMAGKIVCCLAGSIESFGHIKLDGTRSANDFVELRMLGDTLEQRKIKLGKGGGLLLYGRPNLPEDRRNVGISAPKLPDQKEDVPATVESDGGVSIDWQRAFFKEVRLQVAKIDNTGAKPNERLNIVENQFSGRGKVVCHTCDTPVITKNTFEYKGEKGARLSLEGAITLAYCPLSDVRGNIIRGGFYVGIWFTYQSDAVLIGNSVADCQHGISGSFSIDNTMVKQCQIKDCDIGMLLQNGSAVVEDTVIDGSSTVGFEQSAATIQLTNVQFKNITAKAAKVVNIKSGALSLLNCNVVPAQIKLETPAAKAEPAAATCMQYVVIAAKKAPPGSLVDVRTMTPALPADAADPNVRNSPAPLVDGLSPLPKALTPLIVKAWMIDGKGQLVPAPEYTVKLLGPAPKEGAERPILQTMPFRPAENALRATPADATPTLSLN